LKTKEEMRPRQIFGTENEMIIKVPLSCHADTFLKLSFLYNLNWTDASEKEVRATFVLGNVMQLNCQIQLDETVRSHINLVLEYFEFVRNFLRHNKVTPPTLEQFEKNREAFMHPGNSDRCL